MKAVIGVYGCDDSTVIVAEITNNQYKFLEKVAAAITETSETSCMPRMDIKVYDPKDFNPNEPQPVAVLIN